VATSLNFLSTPTSNTTVLGFGASGRVCLSPSTTTDLVIDINGTFSASDGVVTFAPVRILDTRPRYIETFDTPASLDRLDIQVHHRSDHHPTSGWAETGVNRNMADPSYAAGWGGSHTWEADHDLNCGSPDSKRTLNAQDRDGSTYWCRQHFMTSMGHVDGYSTIAFSPKQTFATVSRVCWDQNVTDMGSRQWTELKVTPADSLVYEGKPYLASTGPGTLTIDPYAAQPVEGTLNLRFVPAYDGLRGWQSGQDTEIVRDPYYGRGDPEGLNSSAIRRQHCVSDLGNGQLRLTIDQGDSEYRRDFPGYFPPNARVVFEDHNYTPDKDGNANNRYTWHWDNLTIT
jgi:hypothetical protein